MIEKEKIKVHIKDNLMLLGSIFSTIVGIAFMLKAVEVLIAKMTSFILNCIGATVFFSLAIICSFLWAKRRCEIRIEKKDTEITTLKSNFENEKKNLQSELEDKTKQYNDLFNKTNPRYPIDRLITTEVRYNPTGKVGIEGDPSHLIFGIRVINRTNYDFMPNKAFLACYYDKDTVFKAEWEERAKSSHIIPYDLHRLADGYIQFHVPKQNIEDNMRVLKLKGYVEYITKEDIIHDTQRKNVKVDITNLEYKLDEEKTSELKGK